MPKWKKEIDLHKVISEGNSKYGLEEADDDAEVPKELKEDLIKEISKCPLELGHFRSQVWDSQNLGRLNNVLEEIFDACDEHRIWCGLPS